MPNCSICGEELKPEQKVCDTCGTSVPASTHAGSDPRPPVVPPPSRTAPPVPTQAHESPAETSPASPIPSIGSSAKICPLCNSHYPSTYLDEFCRCGGELIQETVPSTATARENPPQPTSSPTAAEKTESPATSSEVMMPRIEFPLEAPETKVPVRPPPGTVCLVVYSDQKEPIHYCPINKDVTIIGRADPIRGDFPEVDLSELFDTSISRRISRKHALILRSRITGTCSLRPLAGNTGTQIEKELVAPLQDYLLTAGTRIILGGVIRLKFEVIGP